MPNIEDFLTAALRGCAQAQSSADHYSKGVAEEYQKDAILKHFKIPNIVLENISFDLKFAVKGLNPDSNRSEIARSRADSFTQGFGEKVVAQVKSELRVLSNEDQSFAAAFTVLNSRKNSESLGKSLQAKIGSMGPDLTKMSEDQLTFAASNIGKHIVTQLPIPVMSGQIEFYHEKDDDDLLEIRFRLITPAGRLILSSTKSFPSLQKAIEAANEMIQAGGNPDNYEIKVARDKSVFFNLKGDKGQLVARRIEFFEGRELAQNALDKAIQLLRRLGSAPTKSPDSKSIKPEEQVASDFIQMTRLLQEMKPVKEDTVRNENFEQVLRPVVHQRLTELQSDLQRLDQTRQDPEIELVFTTEELKELPESAISSIAFTTSVRNRVWTRTTDDNDQTEYKLIEDPS
jgi:hypothetical protein